MHSFYSDPPQPQSFPTRRSSDLSVNSVTRTWSDANGNFVPDCDLGNGAANGECGPYSNANFGRTAITTRYADDALLGDRKSTRLNSSHRTISYAVFCLKKKKYYDAAEMLLACVIREEAAERKSTPAKLTDGTVNPRKPALVNRKAREHCPRAMATATTD